MSYEQITSMNNVVHFYILLQRGHFKFSKNSKGLKPKCMPMEMGHRSPFAFLLKV